MKKFMKIVAIGGLLLVTVAPIIYLTIGFFVSVSQEMDSLVFSLNSGLLMASIGLTLIATALCVVLGFLVAIGLWMTLPKYAGRIGIVLLLFTLLPVFVHVQSWIFFADMVTNLLNQQMGTMLNFNGEFATILTMAFSSLPITGGVILIALSSVPSEIQDMIRLDGSEAKAFLKIYLPHLIPSIYSSALLVFILNINDYGIASVFGVNTYALELFSQFSSGLSVYGVFYNGLPLIIFCLILLGIFGRYVSNLKFSLGMKNGENPFSESKFFIIPAVVGLIIAGFFVLVPICNLIYEVAWADNILNIISNAWNEIVYGIFVSVLTAIISFIIAILFAGFFYQSKQRVWIIGLAAIPFLIPSSILGLALIKIWNTPVLMALYRSPMMPVIGLVAKYTVIEVIILSITLSSLNPSYLESMRVHWPGAIEALKCMFHLIGRKCIAAMIIVFALAMGDFGVSLLLMPPGYQTLTIKIYNYLHYGASDVVAVLCLFILLVTIMIVVVVFSLLGGEKNE